MLFAQVAAPGSDFLTYVLQGGSLAILAYYFLWVNPRTEKERNESHEKATALRNESQEKMVAMLIADAREERIECRDRNDKIVEAVEKLADAMPSVCQATCPLHTQQKAINGRPEVAGDAK